MSLNATTTGAGVPTLIFVHGYACSLDDWANQIDALSDKFRCVAMDLPGHGGSDIPADPGIAGMAGAVNTVKAGVDGPVILVGHSLGAKIVREACCRDSSRVAGLVLIDGGFYAQDAAAKREADARHIASIGFDGFIRSHFGALFPAGADPATRDRVVERAASRDPDLATALYLSAVEFDIARSAETLREITVPILVLQCSIGAERGGRRAIRPGEVTTMTDLVRENVPTAEVRTITDCGHFPMFEQPAQLNDALREFARKAADGVGDRGG